MESLLKYFMKRPVTGLMLFFLLMILGAISITKIPVSLMPDAASPGITVITRQPGISAEKIEEMLTIPIERIVSDVSGIEKMLSSSGEGESKVNLIFSYDADIKTKILETSEKIQIIRNQFPRDVQEPYIVQYDPSDRPVFIVSFSSDHYNLKELREYVEKNIKIKFERIEGVSQVFTGGGFEREIQVSLDPYRMTTQGISIDPPSRGIADSNLYIPGGKIKTASDEKRVYLDAKFKSLDELRTLPVILPEKENNFKVIHLERIAEVKDHYRERESISRTNGEDRVSIYVQKAGNANTIAITDSCLAALETIQNLREIRYKVEYNQGKYIQKAISRVLSASYQGGVIAVIILFLFLRKVIPTLLVALTIPASVVATFFIMFLTGTNINIMSLSGLALGVGMLIDNSIVVSEAIESEMGKKRPLFDTIFAGTAGVVSELTSSTLTTIIVFLPLIFADPQTRLLYRDLALTVTFSLIVSLLFSITILPCFTHAVYGFAPTILKRGVHPQGFIRKLDDRVLQPASRFIQEKLQVITERYLHTATVLFEHRTKIVPATALFIALSLPALFYIGRDGGSSLDTDTIDASVDLDTGINLNRTQEIVRKIEKRYIKHPDVEEVSSKIEKWHADLHVKLNAEAGKKKDIDEYIDEFTEIAKSFPDASIFFNKGSEGESAEELNIDFYGNDIQNLRKVANDLSGVLRSKVDGIFQVVLRFREPKDDILIYPDTVKLSQSGTANAETGGTLRTMLSGSIITKYYDQDREVDIRLLGQKELLQTPENFLASYVPVQGNGIPLRAVSKIQDGKGETRLWRKNKRKTASVTLKTRGRSIDKIAGDVETVIRNYNLPEDTTYAFSDEYEKMLKSQRQMTYAIVASILLIYFLLGALFESFTLPLLIIFTVPITILFVINGYFFAGTSMNISILIGMIMLCGIMVNNSIILVSTIQTGSSEIKTEDRNKGRNLKIRDHFLLLYRLSSTRIRPILMTTATTVFGMIPMIFDFDNGSAMWRNLAITVSSGLLFSLVLNLLLLPYFYFLIQKKGLASTKIQN